MSLLELGGKQFTIPVGEVALGSDANCAIPLSGAGVLPRHVVLERQRDGQVVIRKATPEAEVLVNGVRLGVEPTPLLHGDKLEVGGYELTFVDERRAGTTQFVEKVELPEPRAAPQGRAAPERAATRNTGGRVVSLTDGREYVMSGASLVFGREAGCDVVVPETDVSRRHGAGLPTRGLEHQRYVRERGARPGAADPPAGRRHPDWRARLPLLCGRRPGGRASRAAGGSGRRDSPGRAGSPRRR